VAYVLSSVLGSILRSVLSCVLSLDALVYVALVLLLVESWRIGTQKKTWSSARANRSICRTSGHLADTGGRAAGVRDRVWSPGGDSRDDGRDKARVRNHDVACPTDAIVQVESPATVGTAGAQFLDVEDGS
jgi:hypothetical protein